MSSGEDVVDEKQLNDEVVEFGWSDDRPVTGRRKKIEKDLKKKAKPGTFGAMGLGPRLYRNIIHGCKFNLPTPIQRKTIPVILQGVDVVGMARTGSGKTAAFVIPILERLKKHSSKVGCRCLIVAPARELALQTYSVVLKLGKDLGFPIAVLVGGDSISDQFSQLASNPDIIVATPGRLSHVLDEVKDFSLQSVEIVVFDEADRLFEMGFAEQIKQITHSMQPSRQTLLFSATMPRLLAEFTKSGLQDPEVIRLDTDSMLSPDLQLFFLTVRQEDKYAALLYLLKSVIPPKEASIVFCSTKHHVAFLQLLLQQESIEAAFVYGAMDQSARKIQVAKFRNGVVSVLLVTDVAARGVDLPLIDNVIHFDFPPVPKLFVHRSGRTARAGKSGKAYSLLSKEELPYLLDLQLFLSKSINPAEPWNEEKQDLEDFSDVYGHFPTHELCLLCQVVEKRVHESEELTGLLKSVNNGFKLYLRTRLPASNASLKRSRELTVESLHPLFWTLNQDTTHQLQSKLKNEMECEKFSQKLKEFRPMVSVFESKVSGNRAASTKSSTPQAIPEIKKTPVSGLELNLGEFKDPEFFIEYERGDRHVESGFSVHTKLDGAVLDLLGEDQEGLSKQQRQYHWDRRSKRYICLSGNDQGKSGKKLKTESGVKVTKKDKETGKIYDTWMKQQKTRIQPIGAPEDPKLIKQASGAIENIGRRFKNKLPMDTQRDDLNPDQIKKKQKLQARMKWKNMPRDKRKKRPFGQKSKKVKTKAGRL